MSTPTLHRYTVPFLGDDFTVVDEDYHKLIQTLFSRSVAEDWHKAGTFKHHLTGVYRTLSLWEQPRSVRLLGLFHSTYGNEYVNLTLFDLATERDTLKELIGEEAEEFVNLFCTISRTDFFRKVLENKEPAINELVVANLQGSTTTLTARQTAAFIVATVADLSEQWYSWQDEIFADYPYQKKYDMGDFWNTSIWPGQMRPPSNMYHQFSTLINALHRLPKDTGIPIPPIYNYGDKLLTYKNEAAASALYWQVVNRSVPQTEMNTTKHILASAIELNPFVGELHLALAQLHLIEKDYENAKAHAGEGLALLQAWGNAWDKRISWEGWISWARLLYQQADKQEWPSDVGRLNTLGLVE